MASSSERVINKALSGSELKQMILKDFTRLIENEGYLADYVAYGRISWRIQLKLSMENFLTPESDSHVDSVHENFPLEGENVVSSATQLTRNVTSPNTERIRNGIPVPAEIKQYDGTTTVEKIIYPADMVAEEGDIAIDDITKIALPNWKDKK